MSVKLYSDPGIIDPMGSDHRTTSLLAALAMSMQAKTIVEAGTYKGRTSIAIALTLRPERYPFHIWTAETIVGLVDEARSNAIMNGVSDYITFHHGDYLGMLDDVPGDIDLAYIDGGLRYPMVEKTRPRLSENGVIVVDDMDNENHWGDKEGYWKVRGMASLWFPGHHGIVLITK